MILDRFQVWGQIYFLVQEDKSFTIYNGNTIIIAARKKKIVFHVWNLLINKGSFIDFIEKILYHLEVHKIYFNTGLCNFIDNLYESDIIDGDEFNNMHQVITNLHLKYFPNPYGYWFELGDYNKRVNFLTNLIKELK